MKALSIKQPWASLIAHGIKDIENRTWKTKFRGRIYIHASGNWTPKPKDFDTYDPIYSNDQWREIIENYPNYLLSLLDPKELMDKLPLSAIIGEVEIVDCVINYSSIWAEKTPLFPLDRRPIYNWVLANPVLYEEPIPAKGKLSFWEPDAQTLELIKNR